VREAATQTRLTPSEQLYGFLKHVDLTDKTQLSATPAAKISVTNDKFTLEAFLKELVTARYLEVRVPKAQTTATVQHDPDKDEWRWGARAEAEIGEQNVAAFIADFLVDDSGVGAVAADDGGDDPAAERAKVLVAVHKAAGSKLWPVTPGLTADDA